MKVSVGSSGLRVVSSSMCHWRSRLRGRSGCLVAIRSENSYSFEFEEYRYMPILSVGGVGVLCHLEYFMLVLWQLPLIILFFYSSLLIHLLTFPHSKLTLTLSVPGYPPCPSLLVQLKLSTCFMCTALSHLCLLSPPFSYLDPLFPSSPSIRSHHFIRTLMV